MARKDMNYYEPCDRAIKAMNRLNVEAFGQLKLAKWDEVNVIQTVRNVYRKSARIARKRYYEVAFEAYVLAMLLCGAAPKKAHEMAEKAITDEWVNERLTETNLVTLYRFKTETDRKIIRAAEAMEAGVNRNYEIDKALRFWSQQLGQYAVSITDDAVIQAFMDYGVELIQWVTAEDERVCNECNALDRQIFRITEIPPKPHWGCRCKYKPVFRTTEAS